MFSHSLSEDILYFILGFGILQGFLLAAFLYFHPKSDRSVNKFLALYILFIGCVMTIPISMNLIGWKNSYILQPFPMLPGVWLYFYIRSFKERITFRKIAPHFIPVIIFLFLTYLNLSAMAEQYPDAEEVPPEGLKRPFTLVNILIRALQQYFYFFLARKSLNTYQHSIQHLFSETSRINLNWTRFLMNGYIVLISSFLILFPFMLRYPQYFNQLLLFILAIGTPYIYLATYKGITQPTIWQAQSTLNKETVQEEMEEAEEIELQQAAPQAPVPGKEGMNVQRSIELVRKITQLMEADRLYQEPELTLQQLAHKLAVPTYQVSIAINEGMKKNFYDLVNGYRVEEAKRLLADERNANYTILSVAFDAGFNSKTTFNTVFKKFTGYTPTEYRNKKKASFLTT